MCSSSVCRVAASARPVCIAILFVILVPPMWGQSRDWELEALSELCQRYLESANCAPENAPASQLNLLAMRLGERLATNGIAGVEIDDLALLVALQARIGMTSAALEEAKGEPAERSEAAPPQQEPDMRPPGEIGKGEEGLRQAVEEFAELPVSERLILSGDVTSGLQAATVSGASALTTTIGRARVNLVLRTLAAGRDVEEGHFFVQMVSAGGAPDGSSVGGPFPFSPINDIATDRSTFNEPVSRGNLYISKAYYEQGLRLGSRRLVARAGILDLSDYFDANRFANNEARQFMNGAFVNSAGYKTGISAPGIVGEYQQRVGSNWLQEVILRGGYAVSTTNRAFTSPLWTGEVELRTLWRGLRANWRIGGSAGNVPDIGSLSGFHTSVDHWIAPRIGIFARYAISSSGPGSLAFSRVRQSYSGGLIWQFIDEDDRVSAFSLGFSQAFGIESERDLVSERILESYYRWQVTRNFSLTPDFQLILGSGGRDEGGVHAVGGMRLHFTF